MSKQFIKEYKTDFINPVDNTKIDTIIQEFVIEQNSNVIVGYGMPIQIAFELVNRWNKELKRQRNKNILRYYI